jgi:hypothetical protein
MVESLHEAEDAAVSAMGQTMMDVPLVYSHLAMIECSDQPGSFGLVSDRKRLCL